MGVKLDSRLVNLKETDRFLTENYGSVLRDCSKVLGLNAKSSKALYRSAMALLALDRVVEALDSCDRCLSFDPDNSAVKGVRERALALKAARDKKDRERLRKLQMERENKIRLRAALEVCLWSNIRKDVH